MGVEREPIKTGDGSPQEWQLWRHGLVVLR